MKRLLLSCDHYVFSFNGQYYMKESGAILLNRYLNVFESLRLAVRVKMVFSERELGIHNFLIEDKRIEVYPIPFFQGPKQYASSFFKIKNTLKLVHIGVDAAIFRLPSTVGFAVLRQTLKKNIPFAVEIVANPKDASKLTKNKMNYLLLGLIHYKLKQVVRRADGVAYVTKNALQKIYPTSKRTKFESYYSSVELYEGFFSKPRLLKKNNTFVLCHVSNQIKSENKGYTVAIKVLKALIDNNPQFNFKLKFAGYGSLVPQLLSFGEKLGIKDKIEFVGHLKLNELRGFLLNSDIMIFPTKSEGLPRCILEAGATGLPVVSAPVGGIPELLPADFLFDFADVEGYFKKIQKLINNSSEYAKESSRLFRLSKDFSSCLLNEKRVTFYRQLRRII